MVFKRILWLLGMLFLAICHVLTGRAAFAALFAAAGLLPLCSLILLRIAAHGVDVELFLPEHASKNEWIRVRIRLKGRRLLSAMRAQIVLYTVNLLTGEESTCKSILANGEAQISLNSPHCGRLTAKVRSIALYDPLGLFCRRISLPVRTETLIQPNTFQPVVEMQSPQLSDADGDEYSSILSGEDPSELFGLRDYREGDPLRSIHWKLSEKYDRTVVKEMSQPTRNDILLILDNCPVDACSPDAADHVCEALISLSQVLADLFIPHQIAWFDRETELMEVISIASLDDLIAMQARLLSARVQRDPEGIVSRMADEDAEIVARRILLFAPIPPLHTDALAGEVTVLLPEVDPEQGISCLPEAMTRWTI